MSPQKIIICGCFIFLFTLPHTFATKNLFCFFDSSLPLTTLDPFLCTHIVYYGHEVNADASFKLKLRAKVPDAELKKLKESNSQLKTLIQVGGYKQHYTELYKVSESEDLRKTFAKNSVKLATEFGFNGVHLVWSDDVLMYSKFSDKEKENFSLLLEEMRKETKQNGLLFTCVIKSTTRTKIVSYDVQKIVKDLDYLILSPAYKYSNKDTSNVYEYSYIKNTIDSAISMGIPAEKIILEASITGLKYKLKNPARTMLGALSNGGPASNQYRQICQLRGTWTEGWDETEQIPYIFHNNEWISYENKQSLSAKVELSIRANLAGFFISMVYDDFNNICKEGKMPLINHIKKSMTELDAAKGFNTIAKSDLNGICKSTGYVNDPNDCNKFYYCLKNEDGSFKTHQFNCPDGLIFDNKLLICNYLYIFGNEEQ